jgi:pyruvate kinase
LNKGPFIVQAVKLLDDVLLRMQAHQDKKTPRLRALRSWEELFAVESDAEQRPRLIPEC